MICLDGVEPALLDRWSRDGALPRITVLVERSLRLDVARPSPFGDRAFWPGFFATATPSGHGRSPRLAFDPPSYACTNLDDGFVPPAWLDVGPPGEDGCRIERSAGGRGFALVPEQPAPRT